MICDRNLYLIHSKQIKTYQKIVSSANMREPHFQKFTGYGRSDQVSLRKFTKLLLSYSSCCLKVTILNIFAINYKFYEQVKGDIHQKRQTNDFQWRKYDTLKSTTVFISSREGTVTSRKLLKPKLLFLLRPVFILGVRLVDT